MHKQDVEMKSRLKSKSLPMGVREVTKWGAGKIGNEIRNDGDHGNGETAEPLQS